MSTSIISDIACPNCGKIHSLQIFTSVNIADNPELKERVLDESLFDYHCDECDYYSEITYPMVYHDPKAGYMIVLLNQGQEYEELSIPPVLNNVVKRRVYSLAELKEKVLIFDSGYSDVAVELVKNALRGIITKTYQTDEVDCYFSRKADDGSLEFAIFIRSSNEPVYHSTKAEVYEQSSEILRSIGFEERGNFIKVDRDFASAILEEYKGS